MHKRRFLLAGSALGALALAGYYGLRSPRAAGTAAAADTHDPAVLLARWKTLLPPAADIATSAEPLNRSHEEWKHELPEDSYAVLFEEDTEPPFSSAYNMEKRPGVFVCRACRLPLFTSEMKFDSGTGWPSFFTSIGEHLGTRDDFKIFTRRTEYHCRRCGGHQGHVFDDGPSPTHQRWCNNGVALRFLPRDT